MKAILIDDEANALETLAILIGKYCPNVSICDRCLSAEDALSSVKIHQPALVFLDIEMPKMNGFTFLDKFDNVPFSVIFTTSYDQYAIRAIRANALDYLLKPIDHRELVQAVNRLGEMPLAPTRDQLDIIANRFALPDNKFTKIALPTASGYELVRAEDILYCEVVDNFSFVSTKTKGKLIACRPLKEIELQLSEFNHFLRVHNSWVVNLNEVEKYVRGDGGYLVMSDNKEVDVSRAKRDTVLRRLHRTE
ncbi:MAG: LytTR family DNA-binding domain-containing protein [Chitinophagaceae bacterium]